MTHVLLWTVKEVLIEPRVNVITLGVSEIAQARKFYEDLGFKA